jgi:RimJ/RimL family protein N-acetyltransferase
MPDFIYNMLTPDHAEPWQALRMEGARDFPKGFLVTPEEAAAATPEWVRARLAGQSYRGVFADDVLIGFCGYHRNPFARTRHRAEVGPFFVTARAQGSGAAQILMAGVIAQARSDGLVRLELYVDTENARAIAFYERQGFERIATHPDSVRINGQPTDDFFYILRL